MTRSPGAIAAAVVLPPLGLHLAGAGRRDFWASVLLTALGFIPGMVFAVHALVIRQEQVA